MKELNKRVIDAIIKVLPGGKKTGDYLVNTLKLGRESVYRRLRNEIPFTFEEIVTVANDLNFSLDELVEYKQDNRAFFSVIDTAAKSPIDIFSRLLEQNIAVMEKLLSASNLNIVAAITRMPLQYFPFELLFKFEFCRYLHSIETIPMLTRFSDIVISPQIAALYEKQVTLFGRLNNITCIVDSHLYSRMVREIQYFYRLNFISQEDLIALQSELFKLLSSNESLIRTGKNEFGSNYFIYYSFLDLDANCAYYEYNNETMTDIWLYPESSILVKNNAVLNRVQKGWLDSKIRNSTLLTKSNDLLRSEAFRKRYKQISELTDVKE